MLNLQEITFFSLKLVTTDNSLLIEEIFKVLCLYYWSRTFGLHEPFVEWAENCLSSLMESVLSNKQTKTKKG